MRRPQPLPVHEGQESVWDYPRPPRLETTTARLEVVLGGRVIARTTHGWRVLETSHPPTYYLPADDVEPGVLRPASGSSWCEWKGAASYFDLVADATVARRAAWTYPRPTPGFEELAGAIAVMPALVERCLVDGEVVRPQPG